MGFLTVTRREGESIRLTIDPGVDTEKLLALLLRDGITIHMHRGQRDGHIRVGIEALGFQALEPQAEAIALPVENLDLAAGAIEEHEQHRVEHLHLDVQLDQRRQAIDGFTKVDGLGVEIDLLHFGVGTHHDGTPRENREPSIRDTERSVEDGVYGAHTNCRQTPRIALPLSLRKLAMVLKSGIKRPVSHINSTLR